MYDSKLRVACCVYDSKFRQLEEGAFLKTGWQTPVHPQVMYPPGPNPSDFCPIISLCDAFEEVCIKLFCVSYKQQIKNEGLCENINSSSFYAMSIPQFLSYTV